GDVLAVGDDQDHAARKALMRKRGRASYHCVPQCGSTAPISAETPQRGVRVGRRAREAGERDRLMAERHHLHLVLWALCRDERPGRRGSVLQRRARHRLRPIDGEHDALCLPEVEGLEAGGRQAVLLELGFPPTRRYDDGDAHLRIAARVDAGDPHPVRRRSGGRCDDEYEADQRGCAQSHSCPPPKLLMAKAARTSSSSFEKKAGGRTTLFAASFSRKCGRRPVACSGVNNRFARAASASLGEDARKRSWRVTTSDSIPTTSAM